MATTRDVPIDTSGRPAPGLSDDAVPEVYDIAIIGAGPAGLHAALKSALLYKTCIVFDKGRRHSRIFYAPHVANIPGFPDGVSGRDLIKAGHRHIAAAEARIGRRFVDIREDTEVVAASREERTGEARPLFILEAQPAKGDGETQRVLARNVILATGAIDRQPITTEYRQRDIETILPYANKGLADYCLLCDGHQVEGKRVAVIGCGGSAATVAASLKKNFHADTALVTCGGLHPDHPEEGPELEKTTRRFLAEHDIPVYEKTVKGWFGLKEGRLGIEFADGERTTFDRGWISMGWYHINGDLAAQLGAELSRQGAVKTDRDCQAVDKDKNPIAGLFAVGDVRAGTWNQIPVGWGEAETAVIHAFSNYL